MSYSHYLKSKRVIADTEFDNLKEFTFRLFIESLKDGTPLGNLSGDEHSFPIIEDDYIGFNGVGENGYETASIQKDDTDYSFCKTAEKDYDKYVVALYHYIRLTGVAEFTSDGAYDDLAEGIAIANKIISDMM